MTVHTYRFPQETTVHQEEKAHYHLRITADHQEITPDRVKMTADHQEIIADRSKIIHHRVKIIADHLKVTADRSVTVPHQGGVDHLATSAFMLTRRSIPNVIAKRAFQRGASPSFASLR